jgi:transposase
MPRGGKGTVYKPQFKQMAIELAINSNKTIAETARELELQTKTLHNWVYNYKKSSSAQTKTNKSSTSNNANIDLHEANKQLKKENARLKMECEILKKATAYFAKTAL